MALVGQLGLGLGGTAALGGLSGDSGNAAGAPVTRATVADALLSAVEAETERRPLSVSVKVRYMTDHISGPQGAAMKWGLELYNQSFPNIIVNVEWVSTTDRALSQYFRLTQTSSAEGSDWTDGLLQYWPHKTAPHVVVLSQRDFLRYRSWGVFPEINDHLLKSDEVVPENYYSIPDTCTLDNHDHSFPQPTVPTGYLKHPQFGLPFELSISGFLGNATLAESAGVRLPG